MLDCFMLIWKINTSANRPEVDAWDSHYHTSIEVFISHNRMNARWYTEYNNFHNRNTNFAGNPHIRISGIIAIPTSKKNTNLLSNAMLLSEIASDSVLFIVSS
jgi:hypothetical protein